MFTASQSVVMKRRPIPNSPAMCGPRVGPPGFFESSGVDEVSLQSAPSPARMKPSKWMMLLKMVALP
jgi:hypothetical protein